MIVFVTLALLSTMFLIRFIVNFVDWCKLGKPVELWPFLAYDAALFMMFTLVTFFAESMINAQNA